MRARHLLAPCAFIGIAASACANVLGLDFVATEPNVPSDGGPSIATDETDATPSHDAQTIGDDSDARSGHLDSSSGDDTTAESDADATANDGAAVINPCPSADAELDVQFPVQSGSFCYSATSDLVVVDDVSAKVGSSNGSFSGVTLHLPLSYFTGKGALCTMDMHFSTAVRAAVTLARVATAGTDIMFTPSYGLIGGAMGSEVRIESFDAATGPTTVGFFIQRPGTDLTSFTPYVNALADAGSVSAGPANDAYIDIELGLSGYDGGGDPLSISTIRCVHPTK